MVVKYLPLAVSLFGAAILYGWIADIGALKHPYPWQQTVKVPTAICLVMAGILLYLIRGNGIGPRSQILGSAMCFGLLGITLALTIGELLGKSTGVEHIFVSENELAAYSVKPGVPSGLALFSFTLIVAAGICWIFERRRVIRHLFCVVGGVSAVALFGYLVGNPALYGYVPGRWSGMAVYTAISFACLAVAGMERSVLRGPCITEV